MQGTGVRGNPGKCFALEALDWTCLVSSPMIILFYRREKTILHSHDFYEIFFVIGLSVKGCEGAAKGIRLYYSIYEVRGEDI